MKTKIDYKTLMTVPGTRYKEVELEAGIVTLQSATSGDVLQWFADNDDPLKKGFAGLRMAVISLNVPVEDRESTLQGLLARDYVENDKIAHAALVLNGLRKEKEPEAGAMGTAAEGPKAVEGDEVKNG